MCQSLFFNKVADMTPATLLKKRLWCKSFPMNFAKFYEHFFLWTPLVATFDSVCVFFLSTHFLPLASFYTSWKHQKSDYWYFCSEHIFTNRYWGFWFGRVVTYTWLFYRVTWMQMVRYISKCHLDAILLMQNFVPEAFIWKNWHHWFARF